MTNFQRLGLFAGQILAGFGGAIIGAILFVILELIISMINETRSELFSEFMFAWIGCYVGLFVSISTDGYKFLKMNGRQRHSLRHILQGFAGLVIGLTGFYFIVGTNGTLELSGTSINLLGVALPFTGTILGFNFKLKKSLDKA